MKKLILASLAVAATLASCEKTKLPDSSINSGAKEIKFSTYANVANVKGNPVDDNAEFKGEGNSFMVAADFASTGADNDGQLFGFKEVKYNKTSGDWDNVTNMYWPSEAGTVSFGAYYPKDAVLKDAGIAASGISFGYTVAADQYAGTETVGVVADHKDIMYALSSKDLTENLGGSAPDDALIGDEDAVNLNFKHALTQIGFTATKDADITVSVKEVLICNVMDRGVFSSATSTDDDDANTDGTVEDGNVNDSWGSWALTDAVKGHYKAGIATAIDVTAAKGATGDALTVADNALMLVPQQLTAWNPAASGANGHAYLAIRCTIKHAGDGNVAAIVNDNYVYVPFSTTDIVYSASKTADEWLPGYKLVYNLHFGGGYTIPGDPTTPVVPEPGKEPGDDPENVVETLRPISYTVTVDEWKTVAGAQDAM